MRIRFVALIAVLIASTVFAAACGTTSPTTVAGVTVTGSAPAVGTTSQLTATAMMSDGTSQDVTSQASWQSSNAAAATVSSSGIVTAVGAGATTVTATYQNASGTLVLTLQ